MRRGCLALLALLSSCATLAPVPLTIPEAKWVEAQPLPVDPSTEKVEPRDGDWIIPLDEEECIGKDGEIAPSATTPCPGRGGLLVSEERITRLKLFQLGYVQLRANYIADRAVFSAQRALYEARLRDASETIQRMQPSWFQLHAMEIGVAFGMVTGIAAVIGIVYGVVPAFKATENP
jgi:hypothetical protein